MASTLFAAKAAYAKVVTDLKAACNLMLHYISTSNSRIEDSGPPLWPSSGVNGLIDAEEYEAKIRSLGQQMTCYKLSYQLSGEYSLY